MSKTTPCMQIFAHVEAFPLAALLLETYFACFLPPPPATVPSYPGTVSNMFAGGAEGPWVLAAGGAAMAE